MPQQPISGLIAAPHTPLTSDRTINVEAIDQQADLLRRNGVSGAFVCGTTGESLSLGVRQRIEVVARWSNVAGDDLPVIVNIAHNSLVDAQRLAAHAEECGAAAIATMGPTFIRPGSIDELVGYLVELTAAAPRTPFYYYHIPSLTGLDFSMVELLTAAEDRLPTLAGVKYTDFDLFDFGRCLSLQDGRYNMLFGRDEALLAALALGARGAVGSTYNLAAPLYLRLIEAFEAGDMPAARDLQHRSRELVAVLLRHGTSLLASSKAAMRLVGIDCGPTLPPLVDLSDAEFKAMSADLEEIGFEEFRCR
ncbi:MAG: dihydrodipicolinate synthase family protein [Planctomycetes bacterium]|nr:dihydrodipicolinate synthase family protein [Planctomycetota bacterium]